MHTRLARPPKSARTSATITGFPGRDMLAHGSRPFHWRVPSLLTEGQVNTVFLTGPFTPGHIGRLHPLNIWEEIRCQSHRR